MKHILVERPTLNWIHLFQPTEAELKTVADEVNLPPERLKEFAELEQKARSLEMPSYNFIVLQCHDDAKSQASEELEDAIEHLSFFIQANLLVTFQHADLPWLKDLWHTLTIEATSPHFVVDKLFMKFIDTYKRPIDQITQVVDEFEDQLLLSKSNYLTIKSIYRIRRKIQVVESVLNQMVDIAAHLPDLNPEEHHHELEHHTERLINRCEQLKEQTKHLFDTHLALVSYRSNETIKLLTIVSFYFMPLTFIVGVYGMNFRYMPEIEWQGGYLFVWLLMLGITLGLTIYFKRKKLF